jgi:hypothetical protein
MNYIQRKMFAVLASIVFALVYLPLHDYPFGLDAAICASFTVAVFANATRKRGKSLFAGEDHIPFLEMLLGHILCLVAVVGIVRLGIYAEPVLPAWLTTSIGRSPGGHPLPSALRGVQSLMLFLVGFVESWWLSSGKYKPESEGCKVVLSKSAYEEDIANRLRLK